ncbi:mitochondrial ribosomal protein L11 precursor, putative [Plasmodium berghei]|uniref:Ribosomal protein L11 n=5 Tax=Plasmodium (Vinckeia) TaxID=418101 RepID=Q7RNS0_PLAYO|nr:mitochondrial ribosomal protein L11 precursor, putative [Plasmodium berghei ANKA]XP_729546.1 mitochondrial ribosomal protein L11 precursor, putative [Plasmodium yoelii]EAA21111.1 putative ribosomal protein L11 [Plasmodium yoelii yoelii]CXI45682.1 mitochondrial ribosomal protein L11 precursor, putative [Plasmodium berghei]CDU18162.1 mitochondrial ribosomal protein L11 precursor, putative [Plasmodium yoelii]SCM22699.1 mitochondrial ribosomal protein L11 precursor, putative [Plasmodium berghei|eukprot:XP_034421721.1 mitochondrial ribosomal protein L11 precursor, putative [Plasmodium berghei ANKA]
MSRIGRFNLIVLAGSPKPSASIGQTLGPLGINMMTFFKEFNERTKSISKNVPIQVTLEPLNDRTYRFYLRTPTVVWFIRRCARVPIFSYAPKHKIVGAITLSEVFHIAKCKRMDPPLINMSIKSICKYIIGTCQSMGIKVCRELNDEENKKYFVDVNQLDNIKKEIRTKNKFQKRSKK